MSISAKRSSSRSALVTAVLCAVSIAAWAGDWTEPKYSMYHGEIAMSYRAQLAGDWLIVEATHYPGWHTYAMDNVQRARKATGKETPETELPTRIDLSDGLKIAGVWKQTAPKDLSKLDIQWYSWGFADAARFAVKVERTSGAQATITINAQSCNATSCSMVRDLKITLPADAGKGAEPPAELLDGLVDVTPDAAAAGT